MKTEEEIKRNRVYSLYSWFQTSGGTFWVPLAHLRSRCATWWPMHPPTSGSSAQQRHLAGNL